MLSKEVLIGAVVVILPALYVSFLPCPIDPAEFNLDTPPSFPDNALLRGAEVIAQGTVTGPETLVFKDGIMYAGLHDGRIISMETEFNQVCFIGNLEITDTDAPLIPQSSLIFKRWTLSPSSANRRGHFHCLVVIT